jgi:hypothetical protein
MGEAKRRRDAGLAARAAREETAAAELSKPALGHLDRAHLPTAVAYVEGAVRERLRALNQRHLVRNRMAWESEEDMLTCNLLWSWICDVIAAQSWCNKVEIREWCRRHYGRCGNCHAFGALPRCSSCNRLRDAKAQRLEDVERALREREGLDAGRTMDPSYYQEVS